jgi:hypothetical protein
MNVVMWLIGFCAGLVGVRGFRMLRWSARRRRLVKAASDALGASPISLTPDQPAVVKIPDGPPATMTATVFCPGCKQTLKLSFALRPHQVKFPCDCGVVHVLDIKPHRALALAPFSAN